MKYHICHLEITQLENMPRVLRAADAVSTTGNEVTVIGFGCSRKYHGYSFVGVTPPCSRVRRMMITSPKMVRLACESDANIVQIHSPEFLRYVSRLKKQAKK